MPPVIEAIQTERVDDVALLIGFMQAQGWPELLGRYLDQANQRGLTLGWVAVVWLSYIISQGDHRKVSVQSWVEAHHQSLQVMSGQVIGGNDFNDDRLSRLLRHLGTTATWSGIEREVNGRSLEVYDLRGDVVRHDATTVSGHHLVSPEGLFQFGHSKDDPRLPQVKVMMSVLDPLGLPLVTRIVSGERADDGLYGAAIAETQVLLGRTGLLHVGDSKMSALSIRGQIAASGDYYLCPLPMTGRTSEDLRGWVQAAQADPTAIELVERCDATGETVIIGEVYELTRSRQTTVGEPPVQWVERILLAYNPTLAQQQQQGLETRIQRMTEQLQALTNAPKQGKRRYRDRDSLQAKVDALLTQAKLQDYLRVKLRHQTNPQGDCYLIDQIQRQTQAIATAGQTLGWRPYVSNAPKDRLSATDAVLIYRDEWSVENGFRRFKGKPLSITPLFVQRDDQVQGLMHLITLALHLVCLMQFLVRQHLQQTQTALAGLYPDRTQKTTATPTTERLLKAFQNWHLTILQLDGHRVIHAPPLSPTQIQILQALGLPSDLYARLATSLQNSS
jgi:transposase